MTQKSLRTFRHTVVAAALLGMTAFAIAFLLVPSSEAAPSGNCTYYNNANHTAVVGQYGYDCCNNFVSWGRRTAYYTCGGCFICYPPNP
jgi:hypothetical protein